MTIHCEHRVLPSIWFLSPFANKRSRSKAKSGDVETPILSPKLDEIVPNMVSKLSPSNIKRFSNSLMEEWEKSLVAPDAARSQENSA